MKLLEFEAKEILRHNGIPVPRGALADSPDKAAQVASDIGRSVVIKAQVPISGRGKAGGIKFADGPLKAREAAATLIGMTIKGYRIDSVLVEEKLDIQKELYVSIAVDAQAKSYLAMAASEGGMEIELTASGKPGSIARRWFRPNTGLSNELAGEMTASIGLRSNDATDCVKVLGVMAEIALEKDAELVEINPLAKTSDGRFVAADARITIDDNSLFRHPEFQTRSNERSEDTPLEAEARRQNLAYVDLSGSVGIIGNGAGLVMATLDLVALFGGKPANFLDIGGGARPDIVKKALLLVMSKPEVKSVFINILGGITRCDLVAEGVIAGLLEAKVKKPVAVRMIGTNEEQGTGLLAQAGVHVYRSMEEAVENVLPSQDRGPAN